MGLRDYRDLLVWQRAMDLVEVVYRATKAFPKEELYGLTSQVRRAVVSVCANIAEGQGRRTTTDFLHFLSMARGSLKEVETHMLIAERLGYIDDNGTAAILQLTTEVGRLSAGLIASLNKRKS